MDETSFVIRTARGELLRGRRIYSDEAKVFALAPYILGALTLMSSLALIAFGEHQHVFEAIFASTGVVALGLFFVGIVDFLEKPIPWREVILVFAVELMFANGFVHPIADRLLLGAIAALPVGFYVYWAFKRYVWEPLVSAIVFAGLLTLVAADVLPMKLLGCIMFVCGFMMLLLSTLPSADVERRERGMSQL